MSKMSNLQIMDEYKEKKLKEFADAILKEAKCLEEPFVYNEIEGLVEKVLERELNADD